MGEACLWAKEGVFAMRVVRVALRKALRANVADIVWF